MSELEKYRNGVTKCIRCGICGSKYDYFDKVFRVCPAGEHSAGFWTNYPSGRVAMALEILNGNLDYYDAPVEAIYDCSLCGNCRQVCEAVDLATGGPLVDHPSIVKALRADLYTSGVKLPEAVNMLSNAIKKDQNIFGASAARMTEWLTDDIKLDPNADTIYFAGCRSSYRVPAIAQATAKILNLLDIPFNILGEEEQCCGYPMVAVGNLYLAEDLMRHNYELLKGKRVITSCAGCYRTFGKEYPKLLGKECTLDATHIVQVLAEQIEQGKVKFTKEIRQKVLYHDPCKLGREMQVYDEPRKVLAAIPGLEVVEFVRNRENAWCCGGGGINADLSLEIAGDKLEQAKEVGATLIATACASCNTNIGGAIKANESHLEIKDIPELVIEAGITKA